jgi:hypothetical protein
MINLSFLQQTSYSLITNLIILIFIDITMEQIVEICQAIEDF